MSTPALREFPGLGEPMSFMPSIVEQPDPSPIRNEPMRHLDLVADSGPALTGDTQQDLELPDLSPTEEAPAPVAPEAAAASTTVSKIKKFKLMDPNQPWVMYVAIGLMGGILAASLVSSFTSVYAMAAWVGLPAAVQWLPVVILDVAIVGFSWALMVFSSRLADEDITGESTALKRERTGSTRLWLTLVTSYSVVANFLHTYDYWHGELVTPQAIMGAVFSASIPLVALVATEELIRLVFIRRKRIELAGVNA